VIAAAIATGLRPAVVTFDPHPRLVLGYEVQLLSTTQRRCELIGEIGIEDLLLVEFTPELALLPPEEFATGVLGPLGTRVVLVGGNFRFGRGREGDAVLLRRLGFDVRNVELVPGVSSSRIRSLLAGGEVQRAAELLGRPFELEGVVVTGDRRGGTLGFPTANLAIDPHLAVPAFGIYAGAAIVPGADRAYRVAMSIGVNPHYGGTERRIEAFLLDFDGDLYGRELRVEVWRRLRGEEVFATEAELVAQIAQDVEAARTASRPGIREQGTAPAGERSEEANC
jgi:riboflavin kinase/FMN adenylyltransferase